MSLTDGNVSARVRVKICGITRIRDAVTACELGADAIGLVFYAGSPRAIDISTAKSVLDELPPFISTVGLFVDAQADEVQRVLDTVALDLLQFHGNEPPDYCRRFSRPYIKAVRMRDNIDLNCVQSEYAGASALLLDTYMQDKHGGTGETFDWTRIPAGLEKPLILAGGLTAANVKTAIEQVKPYAVDVSGGVESGKGIKDRSKIADFIREVNDAYK